ncbi:hypothetical protein N7501_009911 [Penicillium viridicatum]|nr:hypothetical protein N7501_009911 [Penicillium viridicatum]
MDCCLQFRQFMSYCTDIEDYGGTKPKDWDWDRLDLGPFSTIRSLQFTIRRDKERPNESDDTPSANTRSRNPPVNASDTRKDEEMRETQDANSDPMSTDGDLYIATDSDSDSERSGLEINTKHPKEGSGEPGGFTRHIKEFSGESAAAPQTSEQINSEKLIESTFIFLLHSLCLKLGNLDLQWSLDSPQSKVTLGKASIVAAHDGQLGCSKPSVLPEAIIEVKASVLLASHAKKVLMQMGIEMMIWIVKCHQEHQEKKGYFMFCQHGHEMWIVIGKCGPGYLEYLLEDDLSEDAEQTAFLTLKLYGPFNIFNFKHMLRFAPLVVGVTLQRDMDYKASTILP